MFKFQHPNPQVPFLMNTYDVIFAGGVYSKSLSITVLKHKPGGAAACVAAGRLAAADPTLKILVGILF